METKPAESAIEKTGAFAWVSGLSKKEKRVFGACVGGWALDAMDVQIYSFVVPALIAAWGITRAEAGQLQTAALVTSAIGGVLAGWLADRIGRVRMLQIAILWFAVFSFLSGLTQNITQLYIVRSLLGLGFGGEWAAGAVLLGESVRAEHRGKALGTMQAGWAVGWGIAAILYTTVFSNFSDAMGWRLLFMFGILPALLVFFVRRYVEEPEVYLRSKAEIAKTKVQASILEIFKPPLFKVTFLGALMGTGAQGGYFAVTTFLPTFLRTERKLSVLDSTGYLAVLIAGSFLGYMSGGYLSDKIGRRSTFLIFAMGAAIVAATYTTIPFGDSVMLALGFPLGFLTAGVFSGMGPFFTEQFPTRVRGVGQGFSYNFGRALGALFPSLVGMLSTRIGLGYAIGLFAGLAYGTMAVAAFLLPETKGRALT